MIFLCYFAKSPIHIMGFKIPEVLHWVIPGIIGAYAYNLPVASKEGYKFEPEDGGLWIGGAFVQGFEEVGKYFGIVLPVAIGASASGLMALTSAWNAGDPYPIGETMITDGLFTIIGALFGSPMGTVIYFGHPIHKKIGGKTCFSFANGLIHLILNAHPDPNPNPNPDPNPSPDPDPNSHTDPNPSLTPTVSPDPNPRQASSTSSSACRASSPFSSTPSLRWPTARPSSSSA